jgi:CubicO group peptidase (beta-lactamase class C family)
MQPGTIVHAASIAKQFTAMAVMLLVRDGRLSLDDDVRRYVPELPDYGARITVRHLLTHTSGLRDLFELLILARGRFEEDRITDADALDVIGRQTALNFVPGTEYLYSNTGYVLAALDVKRASGQSLRDFAAQRIFTPLGMSSTRFQDDFTALVPGRAAGYARRGGAWRSSMPNYDVYGSTNLLSTVGDLLRWAANLDDPRVGDAAIVRAMSTGGLLANGDSTG